VAFGQVRLVWVRLVETDIDGEGSGDALYYWDREGFNWFQIDMDGRAC
jgi:hypothetical protein